MYSCTAEKMSLLVMSSYIGHPFNKVSTLVVHLSDAIHMAREHRQNAIQCLIVHSILHADVFLKWAYRLYLLNSETLQFRYIAEVLSTNIILAFTFL